LAGNAKRRGDQAGALRWSEQAFGTAEGPATRLQWAQSYVSTLIELTPQDEARIERTAQQLFAEAAAQQNAFYERSARSLQRVGTRLQTGTNRAATRRDAAAASAAGQRARACRRRHAAARHLQGLLKPRPRRRRPEPSVAASIATAM